MKFFKGFAAVLAALVLAPAAHATELWEGASAGDSEADILARFDEAAINPDPETLDNSAACKVWIPSIEVVERDFHACFYFRDDVLVQVMLSMNDEPSARRSRRIYREIVEQLEDQYGEPDDSERSSGLLTLHTDDWIREPLYIGTILAYVGDGQATALNINYREHVQAVVRSSGSGKKKP